MSREGTFREVQRFWQWLRWAILGVVGLVTVVGSGPFGLAIIGAVFWFTRQRRQS